jgi:regulator of replication initiation timing
MKTLTKLDLLKSKFGAADVSIVFTSDLKKMVTENEELHTENTLLKIRVQELESKVDELANIKDCTTFVRLYA